MNFNKIVASIINEVSTSNNYVGLIIIYMIIILILILIYLIYINKKS